MVVRLLLFVLLSLRPLSLVVAKPLKVVLLAGQSNVFGFGSIEHLDILRTEEGQFTYLWNGVDYKERDDVFVRYKKRYAIDQGSWKKNALTNLTVNTDGRDQWFGPEVGLGWTAGDALSEDVLILSYAVGGTDLYADFRPPSSGKATGVLYTDMIDFFTESLSTMNEYMPNSDGYELSGFVWFQGTSDYAEWDKVNEYFDNLKNLLRDVRRDLSTPELPFVVAGLGEVSGEEIKPTTDKRSRIKAMRDSQRNVTLLPENKGKAVYVGTGEFFYPPVPGNYDGGWHYHGRADSFMQMGNAFGEALLTFMDTPSEPESDDSPYSSSGGSTEGEGSSSGGSNEGGGTRGGSTEGGGSSSGSDVSDTSDDDSSNAGLIVGMVIVGLVCGGLLVFIVCKRKGLTLGKREQQEDSPEQR